MLKKSILVLTLSLALSGCGKPSLVVDLSADNPRVKTYKIGHFEKTPPMPIPQYAPYAFPLQTGKVLVYGGTPNGYGTNVAQLYDWKTNSFKLTGKYRFPLQYYGIDQLKNGNIVIVGGMLEAHDSKDVEIYDIRSGKFKVIAHMSEGRLGCTATTLKNGRVLITGGGTENKKKYKKYPTGWHSHDTAELYDPVTNTLKIAGKMRLNRFKHSAILLQNGKVLIIGGGTDGQERSVKTTELYDPKTNKFNSAATMHEAHAGGSITLLKDGRVLIAGGFNNDRMSGNTELYDPIKDTFTYTGSLNYMRAGHGAVLLPDGKVLIKRGNPPNPFHKFEQGDMELYDPVIGQFRVIQKMSNHESGDTLVLLPNKKVLILGKGSQKSDALTSVLYVYP